MSAILDKQTWDKFYSVYMFDNIKYHKLVKDNPLEDRNKLKNNCYVLDENGLRIHLGDEDSIYRIKTLHKVQETLATYAMYLRNKINNYWEQNCSGEVKAEAFTFYYERYDKGTYTYGSAKQVKPKEQLLLFDVQASTNVFNIKIPHEIYQVELNNTWNLPIKKRLKLHIEALRLCRKGVSITEACNKVIECL